MDLTQAAIDAAVLREMETDCTRCTGQTARAARAAGKPLLFCHCPPDHRIPAATATAAVPRQTSVRLIDANIPEVRRSARSRAACGAGWGALSLGGACDDPCLTACALCACAVC